MAIDNIVVLTHVFDQVDLLRNFFAWYSEIGVDSFIVQDMGSTDGTLELLEELAQQYPIDWFSLEQRDLRKHRFGNTGDEMAMLAREKLDPKWLLMCDVDEFLVLENEALHLALERAESGGVTSITIPCFNMTGPPLSEGADALACLSLRIVSPYRETVEQQVSGILPRPYIFIRHPPKSIVMAAAFSGYVAGSHGANVSFGKLGEIEGARFNHYSIRGFDKFQQKIRNTEAFLKINNHLESWWAWHWRRWIRLEHLGKLKDDYDSQFISEAAQNELIRSGICVLDTEVSEWARGTQKGRRPLKTQEEPSDAFQGDRQVVLNQWFLCNNAFKASVQIDTCSWTEFSPFIFWLVDAMTPRAILDIGAPGGSSALSFCEALDQSASDGRCLSIRHWTDPSLDGGQAVSVHEAQQRHQLSRQSHRLTLLDCGIDEALMNVANGSIDIVSIDGSCRDLFGDGIFAKVLEVLSDRAVILVRGINIGSIESGIRGFWNHISKERLRFELYHGDGLGIIGIGRDLPEALQKVFALSAVDARMFRNIYEQLGRAVRKSNAARGASRLDSAG
jgi:glycosyltransferase involved in cell wall biosynthesis